MTSTLHNTETVLFFSEGQAYRLPMDLVRRHPDFESLLLPLANEDITDAFAAAGHSRGAERLLRRFRIQRRQRHEDREGLAVNEVKFLKSEDTSDKSGDDGLSPSSQSSMDSEEDEHPRFCDSPEQVLPLSAADLSWAVDTEGWEYVEEMECASEERLMNGASVFNCEDLVMRRRCPLRHVVPYLKTALMRVCVNGHDNGAGRDSFTNDAAAGGGSLVPSSQMTAVVMSVTSLAVALIAAAVYFRRARG